MKSLNKIDKRLNHKSNLLKGKQKFQEVLNHPLMRSFIKKIQTFLVNNILVLFHKFSCA